MIATSADELGENGHKTGQRKNFFGTAVMDVQLSTTPPHERQMKLRRRDPISIKSINFLP